MRVNLLLNHTKMILCLIGVVLLCASFGEYSVRANVDTNILKLDVSLMSSNSGLAQGYSDGLRPFLESKPFNQSYTEPLWINSFFDHKLPIHGGERIKNIPGDIGDLNREYVVDFLNMMIKDQIGVQCDFGTNCYSGHEGIDYQLSGKPVIAPADGVIRFGNEADDPSRKKDDNGNILRNTCKIWIDHDASVIKDNVYDFSTLYMHLSGIHDASLDALNNPDRNPNHSRKWSNGDVIRKGEVIGTSGRDRCGGDSTGAHLHFGVATGSAKDRGVTRVFDPYGWWSIENDPWADSRLDNSSFDIMYRPTPSLWAWSAPLKPAKGTPGYWGDGVEAQVDDMDASFQLFGSYTRRLIPNNGYSAVLVDSNNDIRPIGSGSWRSSSIVQETDSIKKNWAVWGLQVSANGKYRIQVHFPKLPSGLNATKNARYTIYIPNQDSQMRIVASSAINQQASNEWRDIVDSSNNAVFDLNANTVVLVSLSDVTGASGESVLFDAIRLKSETPVTPPQVISTQRVGFAIDNSSSMLGVGKLNAVQTELPAWVDNLSRSNASFAYSMVAFANNLFPIQQTSNANDIKAQILALSGNDNGVGNGECPEDSLGAVVRLASFVQGGNTLLFTDDLPLSVSSKTIEAYNALSNNKSRLHAIVLPNTCGSNALDPGWLSYRFLSFITGGTYQSITTDKTDEALQIVLREMQAQAQLGSGVNTTSSTSRAMIQNSSVVTYPITVDGSVTKVNMLLNIASGNALLNVIRPDGSLVSNNDTDVTFLDSGSAKYYQISNPTTGTWVAVVTADGSYNFTSSAETTVQFSYIGETRGYPNRPVELVGRVTGSVSSVTFAIEKGDGLSAVPVTLHDDGRGNDFVVGDGIYTGWYTPTELGDFRLRVNGKTLIGEEFSRIDSRSIRVQGLRVIAPPSISLKNGTSETLNFTIENLDSVIQTYDIAMSSDRGWIQGSTTSRITIDPQKAIIVPVKVVIPSDTPSRSIDKIWLTATKSSDQWEQIVIDEDNVIIMTDNDDDNEPSIGFSLINLPIVLSNTSRPNVPTETPTSTPTESPTQTPTVSVTPDTPTPSHTPTSTNTPTPTPTTIPSGGGITLRIEAGGSNDYSDSSGLVWQADTGSIGGNVVDRGNISIANTNDPRLYQTERWGLSAYNLSVVNGIYTVRLHFAETVASIDQPGERVFGLSVEGTSLGNVDIVAQAGGQYKALVKAVNVAVTDGQLDIGFTKITQNPAINAIEIIPTNATVLRIEAGSNASYLDQTGNTWVADTGFIGGNVVDRGAIPITSTSAARIYQTERWGLSGYVLPVTNGTYTVNLHFAETSPGIDAIGERIFGVDVEGTDLGNIDIVAQTGGQRIAIVKSVTVDVADGQLNINFIPSVQSPAINGIEIIPVLSGNLKQR
jgi:murein DD-endopeptidase MepM/ murein hydrolase activator NlpD